MDIKENVIKLSDILLLKNIDNTMKIKKLYSNSMTFAMQIELSIW